jgi:hypothetical protein
MWIKKMYKTLDKPSTNCAKSTNYASDFQVIRNYAKASILPPENPKWGYIFYEENSKSKCLAKIEIPIG